MFEEHGLLNLHDFEARARAVMRKSIFDMVDGGFNDEITYKRTQPAFDSIGLVPRYLKDVSHVDTSTRLLGHQISLPVLPAPSAPQIGAHPDGDLATCRAAGAIGTIEILSHGSDFTVEGRHRRGGRSGVVQHLYAQRPGTICASTCSEPRRRGAQPCAGP